jgi:DNA repair exonuclease SbcCD ATPase subunit
MHGIIPIKDPSLSSYISEKLQNADEKLQETNKSLNESLQSICTLKSQVLTQDSKARSKIKKKFDEIIKMMNIRKQEMLDELDSLYKPILSKLDTLFTELQTAINNNQNEINYIQKIKAQKTKSQIEAIRPFKVRHINQKLIVKVSEACQKFPSVEIDNSRLLDDLRVFGKLESGQRKTFFGFKLLVK